MMSTRTPSTKAAFEREINDRTLLHAAPAVAPAEGDMHGDVERPKALPALRWPL
jgi:hypothetical protein